MEMAVWTSRDVANPSVRSANSKRHPNSTAPKDRSAQLLCIDNMNIRDILLIKMDLNAKFTVKHCAIASVRHSTIEPQSAT